MPRGLSGATPYLIGEALGIYGLTQGLLQIPFGLLVRPARAQDA